MKKMSKLASVLLLFITAGVVGANAQDNGQRRVQNSYEVVLHMVTGSNGSGESGAVAKPVRQALEKVSEEYPFRSFYRVSTNFSRISSGGQINGEAIVSALGSYQIENWPIQTSWQLGVLDDRTSQPGEVILGQFHFRARVPSRTGSSINYEKIEYQLNRISISKGRPTVIGSQLLPQTDEVLFFVVTVREVS